MNLVDVLNQIWTQILQVTALFVTPDWAFIISLLPILILLGLVGPFMTGLMLGTAVYLVRRPRVAMAFEEGPRVAEIGPGGSGAGRPGRSARRRARSRRPVVPPGRPSRPAAS